MSLYPRSYGSWSSKGSSAVASPLERTSKYGTSSVSTAPSKSAASTASTAPGYRAAPPTAPDKPSVRERYAGRSFGGDTLRKSPEPKAEPKTAAAASSYKRYSSPYSPTETPSLRLGSSSRFGGQIARSPITEKSPTVFGVSRGSVSSRSVGPPRDEEKRVEPPSSQEMITLVTRGTSPTPPSNSSFLRARRAEMDRTLEKTIPKLAPRHTTYAVECQTDEKCIEDAKLESKLSAASALTARTSSPASSYSRFSSAKYTPRTSAYHGPTRPSDLTLRATSSLERSHKQEDGPSPSAEEKSKKLEGRDTTRIGGFSYARPTDLPLALNTDGKSDALVSPSKLRSSSPQTPSSTSRSLKREGSALSVNKTPERNEDTLIHSSKVESPPSSVSVSPATKPPSPQLASPDRCKLPPPSPKLEFVKNIPNKDFRKSELNKSLSSSNESLSVQKSNSSVRSLDKKSVESPAKSPAKLSTSKSLIRLPSASPSPRPSQTPKKLTTEISSTLATQDKEESSESSSEESSSSGSSSSSETESSESEEEEEEEPISFKPNALTSTIAGSKLSLLASRTSLQMSSADEASKSLDKPPRPPSGSKSAKGPEEAKAVVIRALEPVASVMKVKYPSSSADESSDKDTTKVYEKPSSPAPVKVEKSGSKSSIGSDKRQYRIHHIQSGERAWWMGPPSDSEKKTTEKPTSGGGLSNNVDSQEKEISQENLLSVPPSGQKSNSSSETEMKPPLPRSPVKKTDSSGSGSDAPGLEKSPSVKSLRKDKSSTSLYRIKRIESGERPWWQQESDDTSSGIQEMPLDSVSNKEADHQSTKQFAISRIESGERAWWMGDSDDSKPQVPKTHSPKTPYRIVKVETGDRAGWIGNSDSDPSKLESPVKQYAVSKVEEPPRTSSPLKRPKDLPLFIGRHTNIDDVLGTQAPPPAAFRTPQNSSDESEGEEEEVFEVRPEQVKVHEGVNGMIKLDDTALQLYKEGDYGSYLDLDASINEQQEEFENFQANRKNSIVLRTQLSVRVHTIIEKLMTSEGRELRRALFSLKQIFQEDKDLVHEFVQNDGLACLIRVGSDADQNYQNYILRALGQVMLYVDGMNGVMEHGPTVQWLYSLVASRFRLVVKTALKLLLVFVEYTETNSLLLVKAIQAVDSNQGAPLWSNVMRLTKEYDAADTELLIYATSLINKTLNGLPDQDMYYDQVDALEEQGLEHIIRRYMSKQGTDLDLLRQFQIYEAVLQHEDGNERAAPLKQLDESIRKTLRHRKSLTSSLSVVERRKSRRHSTGTSPRGLDLDLDPSAEDYCNGGVHNGFCNGNGEVLEGSARVRDLTQKLATSLASPPALDADGNPMRGLISRAKEGLVKSQSRPEVPEPPPKPPEVKKSETELHWEELVASCARPLTLCDLDFTDLPSEDETSVLAPASHAPGAPPPPPPCAPPPIPAPTLPTAPAPPAKNKKTVKLFWKEVRDDPVVFTKLNSTKLIWDELCPVSVDTQKLEHLFESRAKDLITKKQQELNKSKEVIVLDPKRSNAINIGMTKLPPPRSIKTAILKMDATIMNREGIEKLLTMLPTEEECSKIQEAQAANPDLPLGSAEQFLLTLASISELAARLKLWAFKLDFENSEKEIAEPLMDLKQGIETLRNNKTFRAILGTLLSIGIFLNGSEVKGFQIEYLAKVPEVKDTVHKHSLLHHLCHMVMDKFPDSTDLYSEIGAVTRASKVDYDELSSNIGRLESECKASFDYLKVISKHDGSANNMKVKMSDFLVDCAEHIIVLARVHRRVMNRFHKFCLWLGVPYHRLQTTRPSELCRVVSEFALEYRTTRERVLQQLEKKASHRERNKTRGKMITEVGKFRSQDDRADAELRQLLGNDSGDNETNLTGSLPWRRQRRDNLGRVSLGNARNELSNGGGGLTDADDEILESLVKTATKAPATRTAPRERKRTRHADRKSLRRTLRNGLSDEERKHLATFIKGY